MKSSLNRIALAATLLAGLALAPASAFAESISFTIGSSSKSGIGDSYSTTANNSGSFDINPGGSVTDIELQSGSFVGGGTNFSINTFTATESFSIDGTTEPALSFAGEFQNLNNGFFNSYNLYFTGQNSPIAYQLSDGYTLTLTSFGGTAFSIGAGSATLYVTANFTLSSTSSIPAVPEPASLAMVACGLGLAGVTAIRRRRRAATA